MIIKDYCFAKSFANTSYEESNKKILIICGTHGDETMAIKACWEYYRALKDGNARRPHREYKFIFLANESAVKCCCRGYVPEDPEDSNLNRAFADPAEPFEEIVNKIKGVIEEWSPDVVIDVHNSIAVSNTVLIDYGPGSHLMMKYALKHKINPMLRPTQNFGTIKMYCLKKCIPAYTIEMGPMHGERNNVHNSQVECDTPAGYIAAVEDCGVETAEHFWLNRKFEFGDAKKDSLCKAITDRSDLMEKAVYSPVKGIVEWMRDDPLGDNIYKKGENICTVTDLETEIEYLITAPEDLVMQDIPTDVVFEGDTIFDYTPLFVAEE